jgi:hypothetical protein
MKTCLNTLIILSFLSLYACSKSNNTTSPAESNPPPVVKKQSTSLQITTTDTLGTKMPGSIVTLYASQADFISKTNPVSSGITDASGNILFDSLSGQPYYWSAKQDCMNNANGVITTGAAITANTKNTVTTKLAGTGTIMFVNQAPNPFSVYVNGKLVGTAQGGSSFQTPDMPAGNCSVRVLQNSGYTGTPEDKTYSGNVTCGGILVITFS